MKMTEERLAVLTLGAIMEMSDHAQKMGGSTCIAGIAALHRMQCSIQKNRPRVIEMLKKFAEEEKALADSARG